MALFVSGNQAIFNRSWQFYMRRKGSDVESNRGGKGGAGSEIMLSQSFLLIEEAS